jgi:hypothetical protein
MSVHAVYRKLTQRQMLIVTPPACRTPSCPRRLCACFSKHFGGTDTPECPNVLKRLSWKLSAVFGCIYISWRSNCRTLCSTDTCNSVQQADSAHGAAHPAETTSAAAPPAETTRAAAPAPLSVLSTGPQNICYRAGLVARSSTDWWPAQNTLAADPGSLSVVSAGLVARSSTSWWR